MAGTPKSTGKSQLAILLIGRTGMGKSTTGNLLIDAECTSSKIEQLWPMAEGKRNFDVNRQQLHSVTKHSSLLKSFMDDIDVQVLDTVGFAGSDVGDVHLGNLQVAREIAGVSSALELTFDKVLYFLPYRGTSQRIDATLKDEIEVMWHFFGMEIFENMLLVSTIDEKIHVVCKEGNTSSDPFMPAADEVKKHFREALQIVFSQHHVASPPCPEVLYIPLYTDTRSLIEKVYGVPVHGDKPFKPEFKKDVCAKCAITLCWKNDELMGEKVGDEIRDPEHTKCHPTFIPKYTRFQKFIGGLAHIVTLGMAYLHDLRNGVDTWPGFYNSEEVCANCGKPAGSPGCMTVGTPFDQGTVEHGNSVRGVVLISQ